MSPLWRSRCAPRNPRTEMTGQPWRWLTAPFMKRRRTRTWRFTIRVGGGDSFASGLIYGLLEGREIGWAVECGVAHGALAMTTPGDTSMASAQEVFALMKGQSARISR